MKKGGYKIIDFGGSTLSSTPVTKTDILTSLKDNYGKVVLLTGIVIGDAAMDDCFSTPMSDGDDGFNLNAYSGIINVTNAGVITYTAVSSIEDLTTDVNHIKAINSVSISNDQELISLFNKLKLNESGFGTITNTYGSSIFGINYTSSIIVSKISNTILYLYLNDSRSGNICIGRATVSSNTIEWNQRFIITGTAYTPTL